MAYRTPTDTFFRFQTWLSGEYELGHHQLTDDSPLLNALPVWQDYRGEGVSIGVAGYIDASHYDLKANVAAASASLNSGTALGWSTQMAGLAAADDNGRGMVGVAPDAQIGGIGLDYAKAVSVMNPDIIIGSSDSDMYGGKALPDAAFAAGRGGRGTIVVADNAKADSLHYADPDTFETMDTDASHTAMGGDRHVISVNALSLAGAIGYGGPSNEMMLISALTDGGGYLHPYAEVDPQRYDPSKPYPYDPTIGIISTDVPATLGLDVMGKGGSVAPGGLQSGYFETIAKYGLGVDTTDLANGSTNVTFGHGGQGAITAGVVALMLEANPDLGWRDVQNILSHAAVWGQAPVTAPHLNPDSDIQPYERQVVNGGSHHNGGGLAFSQDLGFGMLDAHSAVRLAESWKGTQDSRNEVNLTAHATAYEGKTLRFGAPAGDEWGQPVGKLVTTRSIGIDVTRDVDIESLEIGFDALVEMYHYNSGSIPDRYGDVAEMKITLVSPSGTRWVLTDGVRFDGERHMLRRPVSDAEWKKISTDDDALNDWRGQMEADFSTRRFAGESAKGRWTVEVEIDKFALDRFPRDLTVRDLSLTFNGAAGSQDDLFIFNNDALKTHLTGKGLTDLGNQRVLADALGDNTINAAAMTAFRSLSLTAQAGDSATADGRYLYRLADDTRITRLVASDGNDRLTGSRDHAVTMEGGRGNDTYHLRHAGDRVVEAAGQGVDTIVSHLSFDLSDSAHIENLTLTGKGHIRATGNAGDNLLRGNAGNNRLDGGAGNDTMIGGAGNDTYVMDQRGDKVVELAGQGHDHIISALSFDLRRSAHVEDLTLTGKAALRGIGNDLDNVIRGNAGDNVLNGGRGNDTLHGGAGNDILRDMGGSDVMIGGAGNDNYFIDSAGDRIIEYRGQGHDRVISSVSFELRRHGQHLEDLNLTGTANLKGVGNGQDNRIWGNAGDNILNGAFGDDTLYGGAGNDILRDDGGSDRMVGGHGDDSYFVNSTGDRVIEYANEGHDRVNSDITLELRHHSQHIEELNLLGRANIDGTGNGLDNTIWGNAGDNVLNGAQGNDTLIGGAGNDTFRDDGGDDVFLGQAGADVFVFAGRFGNDIIRDFQAAQAGEVIDLSGVRSITGFADLRAHHLTQTARGTVIDDHQGNTVLVQGVAIADLSADDFLF